MIELIKSKVKLRKKSFYLKQSVKSGPYYSLSIVVCKHHNNPKVCLSGRSSFASVIISFGQLGMLYICA